MKVLNLMKKINLLLILILFSALCTGCTKHIVIKFNDYNELMRGTITSNNSKNILIKVKVDSNGVTCSGKSKITNKTAANHILPTYRGLEGNIMLRCDDGRSRYLEWKILNLGLSNFRGIGEDALGNELSFYVDNNEKKVNDKFEQFKKDVAAKPLLKNAPVQISKTSESDLEPYLGEQNKIKKLTRLSPTPTLMAVNPPLNDAKPTSSIEPPKLNLRNPKPIGLAPVPISKTGKPDFIHYMEEQNQKLAQLTHTPIKMAGVSDFRPYLANLERRIKSNWDPPKGNENKRAEVLFKIGRDGRLLSKRIYKSSGFPNYDYAALKAVETAAPFRPLPQEFKHESIDIMFTFDYNLIEKPPLYK